MLVKPTPINLGDGVQRELLYTYSAFTRIFEGTGHDLLRDGLSFLEKLNQKDFLFCLWAGLTDRKSVIPEQMGDNLMPAQLGDVLDTFKNAIVSAYQKNDPTPETATVALATPTP